MSEVESAVIISAWLLCIVGAVWIGGNVAARIIRGRWKTWK